MPQELYSTPELCQLVQISDRTIRRWISRGWINPERVSLGDACAYVWNARTLGVAKRLKVQKPVQRKRRFEQLLAAH